MRGTVLASDLDRDGLGSVVNDETAVFSADGSASASALFLANISDDTTYGGGQESIDPSYAGPLDQAYLAADPATPVRYQNVGGTFIQQTPVGPVFLSAKNSGGFDPAFAEVMLAQARDTRQAYPAILLPQIKDPTASDIQIYNVTSAANRDFRFVRPGTPD